jgi:hypothetical protein
MAATLSITCEPASYTQPMNAGVERKLSAKDTELRRFLTLVLQATNALPQEEDRRYVTNYVNGLLSGGKTWARADEHFVTGIAGTLREIADQNEAARKACEMVDTWLRRRGRI